jgi:hypothetical protein
VSDLRECGESWGRLAASSFDADAASLSQLALLQQAMLALASWLEMVCLKSSLQGSLYAHTEIEFRPLQEDGAASAGSHTIELQGLVSTMQVGRILGQDQSSQQCCGSGKFLTGSDF